MKLSAIFVALLLAIQLKGQTIELSSWGSGTSFGPDIPHEELWFTGILSTSNIYLSTLQIINFKNERKKSDAGFFMLPGLFQLGYGVVFKDQKDNSRHIDIFVGSTSVALGIARMIYKPKKQSERVSLVPFCLPSKNGFVTGFSFKKDL